MCLLMSDRADAAPFSQLILLLPSISISAAHWAEMWLNFLPGKCFPCELCVCEYPLRNSGSARLAGVSLLAEGPEAASDPAYFCTFFNLLYPAFPGLSLQQSFKLRVVEIFLNTAGQNKIKKHRWVLTLNLMSGASRSTRDLETVSQPGN